MCHPTSCGRVMAVNTDSNRAYTVCLVLRLEPVSLGGPKPLGGSEILVESVLRVELISPVESVTVWM